MENTISSEKMSKQLGSNSSLGFRFFIAPQTEDFDEILRLIIKGLFIYLFCLYANGFSEMEVGWRIYLCFFLLLCKWVFRFEEGGMVRMEKWRWVRKIRWVLRGERRG